MRLLVRVGFLAAALGLSAYLLGSRWGEVLSALRALSVGSVITSLVAGIAGTLCSLFSWRALLADAGSRLPVGSAFRVFAISQLGKYIPGSVWTVLAQMELGRRHEVPPRRSAMISILALAISVLAGLTVAAVALPVAVPELRTRYWWVFLLVPLLLAALHPRVVAVWTGVVFRLLRREPQPVSISWRGLSQTFAWAVASWLALGVHFGVLVAATTTPTVSAWLLSVGVFALAWAAGFILIIAPAGAGVREAVLVVGLASLIPAGSALGLALVSRAVLVIVDIALAAAVLPSIRARIPDLRVGQPSG
jgi:uncharacterized membrane protein YbhN (UPF0104 family)